MSSSSSIGGAAGTSSAAMSKDGKGAVSAEAGVIKSVLATLGTLAQQAGTSFKPYVSEVMPLVIEAIQVGCCLVKPWSNLGQNLGHTLTCGCCVAIYETVMDILCC
jgi:hypothetical protein